MAGRTSVLGLAIGAVLLLTCSVRAAAPQLQGFSPSGLQRGVAGELTVTAANLAGHPRLIAPFPFRMETVKAEKISAGTWVFRLTVAPEVAVGAYPVRIQTDDGLSNPLLFSVGQLPQVVEKEDNSVFEAAQAIPSPPIVVEGQAAGNDVDFFKFAGKKGQVLVVDAQCARIGSGVDPSIRLTTASSSRRFVASGDDTPGLLTDARLIAELPEDTDYVVEISDSRYQGGGRPIYRLLIGAVPVAAEVYPLGGRAGETLGLEFRGGTLGGTMIAAATLNPLPGTALHVPRISAGMLGLALQGAPALDLESLHPLVTTSLPELREPTDAAAAVVRAVAPVVFNGRIDPPGDEDRFALMATPGQKLQVVVEASQLGSALDGVLQVLGAKDATISSHDDTVIKVPGQPEGKGEYAIPDPTATVTVPAGTSEIVLALRDLEGRGGVGFPYRIVVTPVTPSFEVQAVEPQVSIPRGGTAAVGVTVARTDYTGVITVTVLDPPPGMSVRPGTIASGQNVGALSISGSSTLEFAPVPLRLVGRGQGPQGSIEVLATQPVVFAQQGILPTNAWLERGLVAVPALATPVILDAPRETIEVVHGFGATVSVKALRSPGADAALAITPLPLPPGLVVPAASLPEKAVQAAVVINTGLEAPLGPVTIVLQAKGKLPKGEQTVTVPAVTLNLVRPVEVVLGSPAVEVRLGSTVEVKGKVQRKNPFQEPVAIKLSGLPAGLKADTVTVGPGTVDFVIKILADAKAAPATAVAQLAPVYQVNKKDYPASPLPLAVKVLPAQ